MRLDNQITIVQLEGAQRLQLLRSMQKPVRLRGAEAVLFAAHSASGPRGVAVAWPVIQTAFGTLMVGPAFRNRGIGGALLLTLEETLATAGCMRLRTHSAVPAAQAGWLKARGYTVWSSMPEFEHDSVPALERLQPLWQRMQQRVPPDAEMITYRQAVARGMVQALAHFDTTAVGGAPGMLVRLIERAVAEQDASKIDPDYSLVIVRNNELVGLLRCRYRINPNYWFIDSIAVAPAYRNSWANVWLRHESYTRRLADGRCRLTRFRARDDQHDTRRYAEHYGARLVDELELLEKKL